MLNLKKITVALCIAAVALTAVESQAAGTIGVKKMSVPAFDTGTFNGEASISLGNSVGNFGTKNFRIDFDVRTTMTNKTMILDKRDVCDTTNFLAVEINNEGYIGFAVAQDNLGTNEAVVTNTATLVNDGNAHHVTLLRSGKKLSIAIDGGIPAVTKTTGVANVDNISELLVASSLCSGGHNQTTFIGDISNMNFIKY